MEDPSLSETRSWLCQEQNFFENGRSGWPIVVFGYNPEPRLSLCSGRPQPLWNKKSQMNQSIVKRCCWPLSLTTVQGNRSWWVCSTWPDSKSTTMMCCSFCDLLFFGKGLSVCVQWWVPTPSSQAPTYSVQLVQHFLTKHNIPQGWQPPYFPDLAPCNFFLFPKKKSQWKGRRFQDVEETQENVTRQVLTILEKKFQECIHETAQVKMCGFRRGLL